MSTHKFKLPSGVECEVKEITGKHQRILTEQSNKSMGENLNDMLADVLVRVGDITGFDTDFVKSMLSVDRRYALAQARMFTIDDPMFRFTWEYLDSEGAKQVIEKEADLSDGFPMEPFLNQYEKYSDIVKEITITLPRSGQQCIFKMMDGWSEEAGQKTKKKDRSSHTALIMRNPRILEDNHDKTGKVPIQANLDNMSLKDIEFLRTEIKRYEGKVDTEMMFEHPEAETRAPNDRNVIVDLLGVTAFFFPSEAI